MNRPSLNGSILTVVTLFGGLTLGLLAGSLTFELIPNSNVNDVQLGHAAIAALPALAGLVAGGAAWGVQMGRLADASDTRKMAIAGMVGFAPITISLALGLGLAEAAIVESFGSGGVPIHRVFTFLFVPSAFLIAGVSAFAIGKALKEDKLARSLLWKVGLPAALAFLIVNLIMESLGWVVGAPGAVERATMLTVMALGNLAAALAGGGLMGATLAKHREQ